jgi:3-oxoacyl-[acyl-carrier protein] reductase
MLPESGIVTRLLLGYEGAARLRRAKQGASGAQRGSFMDELTSVALVTGGSRGIGRAIAEVLAERGFSLYLTYVSRPAQAEAVAEAIREKGGRAEAFLLDVSDTAAVAEFFRARIKDRVRLSVLVNNAGITRDGLLLRMKDEDFTAVLDTNLKGAFACIREAAKIMTRQRFGRIVNIASVSGETGTAGQANYSAAKAGLIGLTKAAAKELAARNITVNAVAPGLIQTDMTAALSEQVQAEYLKLIPLKRYGTPRDVAEAAAFLASDAAAYITGQVLTVDGGMYC